jgi:hypothetical protein
MEILPYQQTPAQPASVSALISAVKLQQSDLDSIKTVRSRLSFIAEIDSRCKPDSGNQVCGLEWRSFYHLEADRLLTDLGDNPSHELAEQAHAAIIRAKFAAESSDAIAAALRTAVQRESRSLESVAMRVLDSAESAMHAEAATHRATLSEAGGLFGGDGAAALDVKIAALVSGFEAERAEARRDPGHWIFSRGIGVDLPPAPPAPKPLPGVKSPARGKVEIASVADELRGDLH